MQCDVLIIGGGLVGASLAIALKDSALSIIIVEASANHEIKNNNFDARSIALSDASKNILMGLGVWRQLEKISMPIETIHVSKKSQFGSTVLESKDHQKQAFGYVSEISDLNEIVHSVLERQKNVSYLNPATLKDLIFDNMLTTAKIEKDNKFINIEAKLMIAADGTHSFVRQLLKVDPIKKEYNQCAVVANIGLHRSHKKCAYERFTAEGLIALLPMKKQRAALVWATDPTNAKRIYELPEKAFLEELQSEFGYRLGRLNRVGRRGYFPLQLQYMEKKFANPIIFVGNASQTLHPVAGQGFNLGLRDVAVLAELIMSEEILNPMSLLNKFEKRREEDRARIIKSTDNLVRFFGLNHHPFRLLQTFGFVVIDVLFPVNEYLVKRAMGYSADNSKLVCGIPLRD